MNQAVAVKAVILRGSMALILRRHAADEFHADVWDLPGGRVAWGENPLDALRREVHEETGLTVRHAAPILVWDTQLASQTHLVGVTFLVECDEAPARVSAEHADFRWVEMDAGQRDHPDPLPAWLDAVLDAVSKIQS